MTGRRETAYPGDGDVVVVRRRHYRSLTYRLLLANRRRVEWWWDGSSRNWIVQTKSPAGYQLGSADIVGTREDAIAAARRRAAEEV